MPNKLNRPEIFGFVWLLENIGNLLGEAFNIMGRGMHRNDKFCDG
jgi:hypothetical protein